MMCLFILYKDKKFKYFNVKHILNFLYLSIAQQVFKDNNTQVKDLK